MLDDIRRHGAVLIPGYALKVRRSAVLVGVAGVPVLFTRFTNDPFSTPKLALLFGCVAIALAALFLEWSQGAFSLDWIGDVWKPVAFFIAPLAVATVLSPYRGWAIFGEYQRYQGLLPYLLLAVLGLLVAITFAGDFVTPARWLAVAGAIAGGYSVLQYFGVDLFDWANRFGGEAQVTSTIGNTNFSGGFLAICLPVAIGLWWEDRSDTKLLVYAVLIAGGVLFSFSQAAWAAGVGGVVFAAGLYLVDRFRWSALIGAAVAVAVAIVVAGYVIFGIIRPDAAGGTSTVQLRSWWWESAIEMAKDYPFFGHGPNSYSVDSWTYRTPEEASTQGFSYSDDPHSAYLSIATGTGLFGLVGLLAALQLVLRRTWQRKGDLWVAAAGGGVVAYAIDAITTPDELTVRLGFWICIGLVFVATTDGASKEYSGSSKKQLSSKKKSQTSSPIRRPWVVGLVGFIGVSGVAYSVALLSADMSLKTGREAYRRSDIKGAQRDLEFAVAVRGDYRYRQQAGIIFGGAAIARAGDSQLIGLAESSFAYLDDFPEVAGLRDRGRVFSEYAQFDERFLGKAADSYATAMALDRYNIVLIPEGAAVLFRAERYEDIVELVEPSLDILGPKVPGLYPIVGLAYLEMGARDAAASMLEQAQQTVPDDPNTVTLQEELATE